MKLTRFRCNRRRCEIRNKLANYDNYVMCYYSVNSTVRATPLPHHSEMRGEKRPEIGVRTLWPKRRSTHRLVEGVIGGVVPQHLLHVVLGLFKGDGFHKGIEVMIGKTLPPFIPIAGSAIV